MGLVEIACQCSGVRTFSLDKPQPATNTCAEDRSDWAEIVARAFQEGKIGHKGLPSDFLNQLLFAEVYNPSRNLDPSVSLPPGRYRPRAHEEDIKASEYTPSYTELHQNSRTSGSGEVRVWTLPDERR